MIFLVGLCEHMVHVVVLLVGCLYMQAFIVGTEGFFCMYEQRGTGRYSQIKSVITTLQLSSSSV